jgi:phosphoketolase
VIKLNPTNFRVFSPDETTSNRWRAVFEVTDRCSTAEIIPLDDHVAPDGRVMEMLRAGSSPDFVDTVVPQTAIVSYWTGDRYPNDE